MRVNVPRALGASISLQSILFASDFSAASMQAMPCATATGVPLKTVVT